VERLPPQSLKKKKKGGGGKEKGRRNQTPYLEIEGVRKEGIEEKGRVEIKEKKEGSAR